MVFKMTIIKKIIHCTDVKEERGEAYSESEL